MGFTYRGRHSDEFGVKMASKSRPILPSVKENIVDVPLRDGGLDFTAANEYGRAFYERRSFSVNLLITANDIYELERKASLVATWLSRGGELIFDDMPAVAWNARVVGGVDFVPERHGRKAILPVVFDAEPFSHGLFDVSDIVLGGEIPLAAGVKLDSGVTTVWTLESEKSATIKVENEGTAYVRPKIQLSADAGLCDFTVSIGGKSISFAASKFNYGTVTSAEIDMEKYTCKASVIITGAEETAARDMSAYLSGDPLELSPGSNTVALKFAEEKTAAVRIKYNARFLYNDDYGGGN